MEERECLLCLELTVFFQPLSTALQIVPLTFQSGSVA